MVASEENTSFNCCWDIVVWTTVVICWQMTNISVTRCMTLKWLTGDYLVIGSHQQQQQQPSCWCSKHTVEKLQIKINETSMNSTTGFWTAVLKLTNLVPANPENEPKDEKCLVLRLQWMLICGKYKLHHLSLKAAQPQLCRTMLKFKRMRKVQNKIPAVNEEEISKETKSISLTRL